jgi:hypothetical protein
MMVFGLTLALAVPLVSGAVAALWSAGWIDPDPNRGLVPALQAIAMPSLLFSPVGLVLLARGAGVRGVLGWTAVLVVGLPALALVWFVSVASLGGLAGEPF